MSSAITIVVVGLLMGFLYNSSKNKPQLNMDGSFILRMNKAYGIIGWLSVIISVGIASMLIMNIGNAQENAYSVLGILSMFAILGILLILASRINAEVTENQIAYYGLLGKVKKMEWNDINSVSFNPISLELILNSTDTKIKLHMHLIGMNSFIELMKKKVEASVYSEAINKISQIDKTYSI